MKKPSMSSRVYEGATGKDTMIARATLPRWQFTLSYGGDSWLRDQTQNIVPDPTRNGQTEFQQLCGLFLQCLGSYGEFFYTDPDDSSRGGAPCVLVGTRTYQPYIPWGNGPFTPGMQWPNAGLASLDAVYVAGALQSSASYTFNADQMTLTFGAPYDPGASVVTADIHFYYRCRFLTDQQNYQQWAKNLWENRQVQFISVKP